MVDTVVIARYEEHISWSDNIPNKFVVQKGEHLDNFGREPSSFLWYIIEHYDILKGTYAFLQGNPFDHCKDTLELIKLDKDFMLLGDYQYICRGDGTPQHGGLPVARFYREHIDVDAPKHFGFKAGGQFIVSAKNIKKHPKEYYQKIYDEIEKDDSKLPWVMERLWSYIFN